MGNGEQMGATRQSKSGEVMNKVDRITVKLKGMRKQVEEIEVRLGICKDVNVEESAKTPEEPNGFFERLQSKLQILDRLSGQIQDSIVNIRNEF